MSKAHECTCGLAYEVPGRREVLEIWPIEAYFASFESRVFGNVRTGILLDVLGTIVDDVRQEVVL